MNDLPRLKQSPLFEEINQLIINICQIILNGLSGLLCGNLSFLQQVLFIY